MPTKKSNDLKLVSSGYAYPLYEQGWNLFAPAPTSNYRIAYRCKVNKEWNKWVYPIDEYHQKHDKLAFSTSGRHALAEYNLIYWIHSQLYKDFGKNYTTSLKTLDEREQYKTTFAYKSYLKYLKFYSNQIDCSTIEGKIEITDLTSGYVYEIILPEIDANR